MMISEEQAAALSAQFAIEQAAVESGKSVEEALAAGQNFRQGDGAKSLRPAETSFVPPDGKSWEDISREGDERLTEQMLTGLRDQFGLDEQHVQELREGKPVSPDIHQQAKAWIDRHTRDAAWSRSLLEGDAEKARLMLLANSLVARPVAEQSA